jgi:pantoate--beta-alanine ligase
MVIAKTISELHQNLTVYRKNGLKTGFVPTMGALHAGHLSLVKKAAAENEKIIVSIFVNPTQFNNTDYLYKYPRMPESDFRLLESEKTDLIFYPAEGEIYPDGPAGKDKFDFGDLEKVMEGKFRPGHFKGVAQVVSRLFELVMPDTAYFGEKDFQQLAVIKELVTQKGYPVKIVGCPTVREPDGLAMSSRNLLLTPEMRKEATRISRALFYVQKHCAEFSVDVLKQEAISIIEASGFLKTEYLEIADEVTLQPVIELTKRKARCLTAVWAGNIRLIDNVQL